MPPEDSQCPDCGEPAIATAGSCPHCETDQVSTTGDGAVATTMIDLGSDADQGRDTAVEPAAGAWTSEDLVESARGWVNRHRPIGAWSLGDPVGRTRRWIDRSRLHVDADPAAVGLVVAFVGMALALFAGGSLVIGGLFGSIAAGVYVGQGRTVADAVKRSCLLAAAVPVAVLSVAVLWGVVSLQFALTMVGLGSLIIGTRTDSL